MFRCFINLKLICYTVTARTVYTGLHCSRNLLITPSPPNFNNIVYKSTINFVHNSISSARAFYIQCLEQQYKVFNNRQVGSLGQYYHIISLSSVYHHDHIIISSVILL